MDNKLHARANNVLLFLGGLYNYYLLQIMR